MTDKQAILGNIRSALRRKQPLNATMEAGFRQRLEQHQRHVQPAYQQDLLSRLVEKHTALHGTVDQVRDGSELAASLKNYIERNDLPRTVVMSESELFDDLNLPEDYQTETRGARGEDQVCVSVAYAAVAETGTLVLKTSKNSPVTHNFLPDHHIVVLETSRVVKWQEEVWSMLRQDNDFPPRGICFVSGPSKTGDVEQTIEYGAHGPRCLHLVLLNPESPSQTA